MDKDQSFINFLIEETMNLSEEQPKEVLADVVALENYFERNRTKSNPEHALSLFTQYQDFSFSKPLFTYKGIYNQSLKTFRVLTKQFGLLDFPENWSCFFKIKNKLLRGEVVTLLIEKDNDIHSFLNILGECQSAASMALVFHNDQFKIILFQESDQKLFHEYKNFLRETQEIQKKSA
jgi:hypothetical protein